MRHWLETMHDCPEEEAHIESVEQFWGSRQSFSLTTGGPTLSLAALCSIP